MTASEYVALEALLDAGCVRLIPGRAIIRCVGFFVVRDHEGIESIPCGTIATHKTCDDRHLCLACVTVQARSHEPREDGAHAWDDASFRFKPPPPGVL